jgi:hypothetical protein
MENAFLTFEKIIRRKLERATSDDQRNKIFNTEFKYASCNLAYFQSQQSRFLPVENDTKNTFYALANRIKKEFNFNTNERGTIMSVKKVVTQKQAVKKVLTPKQSVGKSALPQYTPGNDEVEKVEKIDTGLPANHPVRKLFAEGKLPEQIAQKKAAKKSVSKTVTIDNKKETLAKEKKSRVGEYPFIDKILIEKKLTDAEIKDKVKAEFPTCQDEKQIMKSISACRYFLNKGKRKCFTPNKDGSNKLEQLYRIDGKIVPASKKPKAAKVNKKVVDPKNDPLAKLAGIGPNAEKKIVAPVKKKVISKKK